MKMETFFEKFELFAEAPNAVERMRELILELAVRGKLLEKADHPPSGMGSIEPERNKKIPTKIEPAVEPLFSIPQSWKWTRLASLGDINPRNSARDLEKSSFVPMALISAEYGKNNSQQERLWGEIKKGYTHFMNGDVVMAKITPCFENRKSCVMSGLIGGFGAGTTELHVFRAAKSNVIPEYVIIYLKTRGFIERGISKMTGSAGQKRIPSSYFAESSFPLPPLTEQQRIVSKVDELMTMVDQLEAQIEKAKKTSAALLDAAIHELLNPREAAVDRTGIGCHVVHMLADRKTFGRTALAKFAYLAETHVGLPFNGQYLREAAGPLDPWIYRFEEEAARERWFTFENTSIHDGNRKIVYRKGDTLEAKASEAAAALPQAQRDELDRVLKLLGGKPTEEVEIIATLFAVWNDFLIDGHSPSDENIVTGFREHWHEKKQKFAAKSLHVWLDWMRRNGLVPIGRSPRTQQHPKLDLH